MQKKNLRYSYRDATNNRTVVLNWVPETRTTHGPWENVASQPEIKLAPGAQIRENTKAITLGESKWTGVTKILSGGVYADPILGNVIEHVAAETGAGKTVYIGTRLKVEDGKVKEVEINFHDGPRVNLKNLVPYDPIFDTIVPPEERSSREQLGSIITNYFKGLTDHLPIQADYDPRCDRYHSGTALRTTRGMALRRVGTWAAMRAISGRSLGSGNRGSHRTHRSGTRNRNRVRHPLLRGQPAKDADQRSLQNSRWPHSDGGQHWLNGRRNHDFGIHGMMAGAKSGTTSDAVNYGG